MSEPITTYKGRRILFNNGVVDVVQGETSLVDENKVAHIPEGGNVEIDNLTIIKNADDELEVPFDNNTIYRDSEDGFIKAAKPSDHKVILCTKVGDDPAGPVGSFTLNQNSDKTITIPIPQGGGSSYTAGDGIQISNDEISVDKTQFISLQTTTPGIDASITFDAVTALGEFTRYSDSQGALDFINWCWDNNIFGDQNLGMEIRAEGLCNGYYSSYVNFTLVRDPDDPYQEDNIFRCFIEDVVDYRIRLNGYEQVKFYGTISYWDAGTPDITGFALQKSPTQSWSGGPSGSGFLSNKNGALVYEEPQFPRYFGGIGIDVDDELINARYDEDVLDAPYAALTIKDGVLPKYAQEPGRNISLVPGLDMSNRTQGSVSPYDSYYRWEVNRLGDSTWIFLENEGHSKTYNLSLYVGGHYITSSNGAYAYRVPSNGIDFNQWEYDGEDMSSFGAIMFESYANNSSNPDFMYIYVPVSFFESSYQPTLPTNTELSISYPGDPEIYVDLGSQLGTGWEQDREYTVKFKNGKLYLS